jgi:hypothetical protein
MFLSLNIRIGPAIFWQQRYSSFRKRFCNVPI